ncbi:hypothetical protein G5C60_32275 [Streptomyces sp. HC44]|uniref:Uncharacterized protein n=1 Tax=Streptomyces scabichelini TaxID=2711217 RepID=A0A6G4VEC9_9ACTN|nr:hypothetical protein [Streptomyces scabichelini]NGO12157.1 hypothetical protein [Streptomyces scabichelini]
MVFVVIVGVALLGLVVWATGVLIRRESRRLETTAEGHRIESAATQGIRDARRRARALHRMGGAGGISRLDVRD